MKQWFSKYWISDNKWQWSVRNGKQLEPIKLPLFEGFQGHSSGKGNPGRTWWYQWIK
jgi:hypothetical protein